MRGKKDIGSRAVSQETVSPPVVACSRIPSSSVLILLSAHARLFSAVL